MLALRYRLALAGIITAAAVAIPVAAFASGSGSPAGKPTTAQASAPHAGKPAGTPYQLNPAAGRVSKSAAAQSVPRPRVYGTAAVSALAARLHVSPSAAGPAFKQIGALLAETGRVDTSSPAFAAIAHELGVSAAQLAAAWNAVESPA